MADSIADRFIDTMAAIRELEALSSPDQPMWFQVNQLQMHAERVLDNAIRSAWEIAHTAKRIPKEAKQAANEAVKAATEGATNE
jgi:hypothetical protein